MKKWYHRDANFAGTRGTGDYRHLKTDSCRDVNFVGTGVNVIATTSGATRKYIV